MPVIAAPAEPTHSMHGTDFTALATPSRGSQESAVWRVQIPPGAPPTPHSLTREEVFVVLAGTADVTLGTTMATARVGDAIVVPPDLRFELRNVGDGPLGCCAVCPSAARAVWMTAPSSRRPGRSDPRGRAGASG